ncbi:MAG: histidine--tRNA ligase [Acidobacteriota bacterium]
MIIKIKGTRDIYYPEIEKWIYIEEKARHIFSLYGYKEIRTPIIENTELFVRGVGEETEIVRKEMYTFNDKSGRSITLRPENTASVVRAMIENNLFNIKEMLRVFYLGPMFRYDKPQKGRYRQFHQIGVEAFGEEDPSLDAEIVEMGDFLFKELELGNYDILVNSVGCKKCKIPYVEMVKKEALKKMEFLCEDCRRKIDTNPLRIFDCKNEDCIKISEDFPKITDNLCDECEEHFKAVMEYLENQNINFKVEKRLVRGLDYYTKTAFEFISPDLGRTQNSILGGGRYDDLVYELGGPSLCGIGFAIGMERLVSTLKAFEPREKSEIFVVPLERESKHEALTLSKYLRQNNISTRVEYRERNIKSTLSKLSKSKIKWVVIIGREEISKGIYRLKNMESGIQTDVNKEEILKWLRS